MSQKCPFLCQILIFGAVLSAFLSGCIIYPPERTLTTPETYYLTPQERFSLENKAIKNSDANAAYSLAIYYDASAYDKNRAYKWFKIAKQLGDKRAERWLKAFK